MRSTAWPQPAAPSIQCVAGSSDREPVQSQRARRGRRAGLADAAGRIPSERPRRTYPATIAVTSPTPRSRPERTIEESLCDIGPEPLARGRYAEGQCSDHQDEPLGPGPHDLAHLSQPRDECCHVLTERQARPAASPSGTAASVELRTDAATATIAAAPAATVANTNSTRTRGRSDHGRTPAGRVKATAASPTQAQDERSCGDGRPVRDQAQPVLRKHELPSPAQGSDGRDRQCNGGELAGKRCRRSLREVVELRRGGRREGDCRRSIEVRARLAHSNERRAVREATAWAKRRATMAAAPNRSTAIRAASSGPTVSSSSSAQLRR